MIALAILAPAPTHAQLGGLAKRAKQVAERATEKKVDKNVADKTNSNVRPSDAFGEELTESTFNGVLRGLNAELANFEQRGRLIAEADAAGNRRDKLLGQHQAEESPYIAKVQANSDCRSEATRKIDQKNKAAEAELERKGPMDPKLIARMTEISGRYQAAMEKAQKTGDKAAMEKAREDSQRDMAAVMGYTPSADSAAVEQQCGPRPREPAWRIEANTLWERAASLRVEVRTLEGAGASAGAAAAGMSPVKYALAKERVLNWSYEAAGEKAIQRFGAAERKLFESHKAEIKKFDGILEAQRRTS